MRQSCAGFHVSKSGILQTFGCVGTAVGTSKYTSGYVGSSNGMNHGPLLSAVRMCQRLIVSLGSGQG